MTYISNKNGELMNHSEFRKALANNEKVNINDDFNWNGQEYSGGQKAYLKYMKDRLFRFSCPVISKFAYEKDIKDRIYIHLNPIGYKEDKILYNEKVRNGNIANYYIQNENIFWK
jgi:hypothetical protein